MTTSCYILYLIPCARLGLRVLHIVAFHVSDAGVNMDGNRSPSEAAVCFWSLLQSLQLLLLLPEPLLLLGHEVIDVYTTPLLQRITVELSISKIHGG